MIKDITEPRAIAVVRWLSVGEGGRRMGPPVAPVYAATCIFTHGDDHEVYPDWPMGAEQFSILLEEVDTLPDGARVYKADFLAPDLVEPLLHIGAKMLIMEGPKIVGNAEIRKIFTPRSMD